MFIQPTFIEIHGKVGEEQILSFPYENIELITRIESPCSCSEPRNLADKSKIVVKYKPVDIPKHLEQEGKMNYTTTKIIKVEYNSTDGTPMKEELIFTAHITE